MHDVNTYDDEVTWTHETRFPGRRYSTLNLVEDTPYESETHMEVLACAECGAIVLEGTERGHSDWHDRQNAHGIMAAFPDRYVIDREDWENPELLCTDCRKGDVTGESGHLLTLQRRDGFNVLAAAVVSHEREVHA